VSSPARSRRRYVEEQIAAAGNEVRGRCMKEPTMGRCTRIIGQVCLYARVNQVRDAFMRVKWMTDLFLPHHVRRPSRILLQSLCVAHLFQHPRVVFGEGQIQRVLFPVEDCEMAPSQVSSLQFPISNIPLCQRCDQILNVETVGPRAPTHHLLPIHLTIHYLRACTAYACTRAIIQARHRPHHYAHSPPRVTSWCRKPMC
jgi:hypothetical protein